MLICVSGSCRVKVDNGKGMQEVYELNTPEQALYTGTMLWREMYDFSGGCVLMDSSNLSYLFEEEDGSIVIDLASDYYGEVDFQMQYKNVKGNSFDWLYIDFQTLSLYAAENGFKAELVKEGTHYDYLAKLSRQA